MMMIYIRIFWRSCKREIFPIRNKWHYWSLQR